MEIDLEDSIVTTAECTLGAVISPTKALTAGHCGPTGEQVYDRDGTVIGRITTNLFSRRADIAVIALARGVRPVVDRVDFSGRYVRGQAVSKVGIRTGLTRGSIVNPAYRTVVATGYTLRPPFLINQPTTTVDTDLPSAEGDSGAGIRDSSGTVVGILSSGVPGRTAFTPLSLLPPARR